MILRLLVLLSLFSAPNPILAEGVAEEKILHNQVVTALRGDFKELHFLVPVEGSWEFQGDFKSAGGMNDDITFHALDQSNYVRWFSHYNHKAEYHVPKTKQGKFSFRAKPGDTYYFVFDNFFSSVSNKKIQFNLKLIAR